MIEYLPQILLALSIQTVGILSPGPGVALILGVALERGRPAALFTAGGIAAGSMILATLTVVGLTALLAAVSGIMSVLKIIGAAYLAWLAWKSFGKAINPPKLKPLDIGPLGSRAAARAGFLLQITNPKAILFWLAIAGVGGIGDAPIAVAAVFILLAGTNSFVGHGLYALAFSAAPVRRGFNRIRRWIEGALGAFFAFASFRLVTMREG